MTAHRPRAPHPTVPTPHHPAPLEEHAVNDADTPPTPPAEADPDPDALEVLRELLRSAA